MEACPVCYGPARNLKGCGTPCQTTCIDCVLKLNPALQVAETTDDARLLYKCPKCRGQGELAIKTRTQLHTVLRRAAVTSQLRQLNERRRIESELGRMIESELNDQLVQFAGMLPLIDSAPLCRCCTCVFWRFCAKAAAYLRLV